MGVYFLQQAYGNWRAWELETRGIKRLLSLGLRMLAKLPVHFIVPWLAARLGTDPDPARDTTGLMVTAARRAHEGLKATGVTIQQMDTDKHR